MLSSRIDTACGIEKRMAIVSDSNRHAACSTENAAVGSRAFSDLNGLSEIAVAIKPPNGEGSCMPSTLGLFARLEAASMLPSELQRRPETGPGVVKSVMTRRFGGLAARPLPPASVAPEGSPGAPRSATTPAVTRAAAAKAASTHGGRPSGPLWARLDQAL